MAQRTGGSFWQECAGGCGRRAEANLTPKGKSVLCRTCQKEQKVRGSYLEQPTKAEKAAFVASKSPKKAPKQRQTAARQKAVTAKATTRKRRPKAKAA